MGLFKRKKQEETAELEHGYFIWEGPESIRLFFVGDAGFLLNEFDEERRNTARQLIRELRRIVAPGANTASSVRLYEHYIALSRYGSRVPLEEQLPLVLETIQQHLGWKDMPYLGSINDLEEFIELRHSYDGRWSLIRH